MLVWQCFLGRKHSIAEPLFRRRARFTGLKFSLSVCPMMLGFESILKRNYHVGYEEIHSSNKKRY